MTDVSTLSIVLPQRVDCVLMNRFQLNVVPNLSFQIHLSKHVERRLFPVLVSA